MIVLGVDPGLSGALALLDIGARARLLGVLDVPTAGEGAKRRVYCSRIVEWLRAFNPEVCMIERASVMPKQHPHAGFVYGRAVGALEATVLCCGIKLRTVEPPVWKRYFGLLHTSKKESLKVARRIVLGASEVLSREKDHNRAEAMLIAVYGVSDAKTCLEH